MLLLARYALSAAKIGKFLDKSKQTSIYKNILVTFGIDPG